MRDLPLPTFPIADLDSPWRLGPRLGGAIRAMPLTSLWVSLGLAVTKMLTARRGSDMPPAPTGWERA